MSTLPANSIFEQKGFHFCFCLSNLASSLEYTAESAAAEREEVCVCLTWQFIHLILFKMPWVCEVLWHIAYVDNCKSTATYTHLYNFQLLSIDGTERRRTHTTHGISIHLSCPSICVFVKMKNELKATCECWCAKKTNGSSRIYLHKHTHMLTNIFSRQVCRRSIFISVYFLFINMIILLYYIIWLVFVAGCILYIYTHMSQVSFHWWWQPRPHTSHMCIIYHAYVCGGKPHGNGNFLLWIKLSLNGSGEHRHASRANANQDNDNNNRQPECYIDICILNHDNVKVTANSKDDSNKTVRRRRQQRRQTMKTIPSSSSRQQRYNQLFH